MDCCCMVRVIKVSCACSPYFCSIYCASNRISQPSCPCVSQRSQQLPKQRRNVLQENTQLLPQRRPILQSSLQLPELAKSLQTVLQKSQRLPRKWWNRSRRQAPMWNHGLCQCQRHNHIVCTSATCVETRTPTLIWSLNYMVTICFRCGRALGAGANHTASPEQHWSIGS